MQITRIELENITTHHHTEIEFREGINVFLGQNGAGKSTILKMIGIVLFDYPNSRLDRFVSYSSSKPSGKVSVWFVGKEQKEYKVSRVIGGTKIEVIDPNSNRVLNSINNKEDYIKWLKDQYNLDETYNLETLFENAIGVEQGNFTAPFTYTTSNRKKIFDPILRIDVYEDIYHNFRDILNVLISRRTEIEKDIRGFQGQLTDKESNLKELQEKEEENTNKQKLIADLQQKQENANLEFNKLKSIKDKIDEINTQIQLLDAKRKSLEENRIKLKNDVQESEKSKAICDQNKEKYEEYLKIEKQINDIKVQIKELDNLVKKSQKLEQDIAKIKALLEKNIEDIKSIEKDAEKKDELEKLYEKHSQLNKKLKELQSKFSEIETEEKNLKQLNKDKEKYEHEITDLTKEIGKIPALETLQKKKKELQEIYEKNTNESTKLETQKQDLLKNKNQAKGGQCPFLHEACKNIEGESLEKHFEVQLEEISPKIDKLKKELKDIKNKIELNEIEIEKTHELSKKKQILDEKRITIENLNNNIKEKVTIISTKPSILSQINKIETEIKELEPSVKEWTVLQDKLQKLQKLKIEKKDQQIKLDKTQSELEELKTIIVPLEELKKSIQPLEEQKNHNKEPYDLYQQNRQNAAKLELRKTEHAKLNQEINQNNIEFQNNKNNLIELTKKFDETRYKELEEQNSKILEELSRLKGEFNQITKRIKDLKDKLELYKKIEKELDESLRKQRRYNSIETFVSRMRDWYRDSGKIITQAMLRKISNRASSIFQDIMDTPNLKLEWTNEYEVKVGSKYGEKTFNQLSGGEQMATALSIRLALLLSLSDINIAFFDEPTANLDPEKRMNLANCIRKIKGFTQLFIISHDDTFENLTDNIIVFEKDNDESTKVSTKTSSKNSFGGE